ncbi:MAG: hypothetical protein ACRCUI_10435 [Polymorphobacter sp.]
MNERGSGCLLAIGLMIGAGVGVAIGQGPIGMIAGLVVGAAAAVAFAYRESRRRK